MGSQAAYSSRDRRGDERNRHGDRLRFVSAVQPSRRCALALIALVAVLAPSSALPLGSEEISAGLSKWFSHFPRCPASAAAVVAGIVSFGLVVAATGVLIRRSVCGALRPGGCRRGRGDRRR